MVDKKTNNTIEKTSSFDRKEVVAKLKNCPTSPRKLRLVADQIRGVNIDKALILLKHSTKEASIRLEKLLLSAISNWQMKHGSESSELIITKIFVDSGRMLKRMQPAPQGRAHRIRKRSNHVTIMVGLKDIN